MMGFILLLRILKITLIAVTFLGLSSLSFSAPTLILQENQNHYQLGLHLDLLVDEQQKWTFAEVSSPDFADRFTNSQEKNPNFGITLAAIWARIQIRNMATNQKWLLVVNKGDAESFQLFYPAPSGEYKKKLVGTVIPFEELRIKYFNPVVAVDLPTGTSQTWYIRYKNTGPVSLSFTLWQPDAFIEQATQFSWSHGLYFGTVLIMVLYNLLLFFSLRERSFLYYVLYIFFFGFFMATVMGVLRPYLDLLHSWRFFTYFIQTLSLIFLVLFSQEFLETKRNTPKLHHGLTVLMVVYSLNLGLHWIDPLLIQKIAFSSFPVAFIIIMAAAVLSFKGGYRPARYFILAFATLFAAGIGVVLELTGVAEIGLNVTLALKVGSGAEMMLLM